MESPTRYLVIRTVAAAGLAALAPVLGLGIARAEAVQAGDEPWYRQTSAEARQRAQELFTQAVRKHRQLLRGEALVLYEQALALWDNPDIQWNLALVLEDLGQYLRAHEQLERARRWGAALGPERLREVDDRLRALETERLARIETHREEPLAEITLDGQPWPRGAGRRSKLVLPGEHYISATKPGYFSVTRSVYLKAGEQARVALLMDEDRFLERRRWTAWKPWAVIAAGAAVAAAGAELERRAFADGAAVAAVLSDTCSTGTCNQARAADLLGRAKLEHGLGIGAIAAGGTAIAVGLALVWLNQPSAYRSEARAPSKIELTPIVSPQRAELSVLVRF
jgi:tetratricopeptide (TPR) repeat protein